MILDYKKPAILTPPGQCTDKLSLLSHGILQSVTVGQDAIQQLTCQHSMMLFPVYICGAVKLLQLSVDVLEIGESVEQIVQEVPPHCFHIFHDQ